MKNAGVDLFYFKRELKILESRLHLYTPEELRRYFLTLADIATSSNEKEMILTVKLNKIIHKKSDKPYYFASEIVTDATNGFEQRDKLVLYVNLNKDIFVREKQQFEDKFSTPKY